VNSDPSLTYTARREAKAEAVTIMLRIYINTHLSKRV
jgi:hypothetical protein